MVDQKTLIGGRYRIVRLMAEGGMGAVYEAQHHISERTVALKILRPEFGRDEASRERFQREARASSRIGHDGIVEILDAGFHTEDGSLFVVMEMLDGEPLRERFALGRMTIEQTLDLFEQILDPLAAAHEKGIVHRDLKPENIFLARRRDGREVVKLLDFGIARSLDAVDTSVTQAGTAMGTPHYMAPEQAMSARDVTPASDVWAVGVMLYEALSNRVPFDGETVSAIVVQAYTQEHQPLSEVAVLVPPPLAALVDRCLSKEPANRPADGGALWRELRAVREEIGSRSRTGPMPSPEVAIPGVAPMAAHSPPSYQEEVTPVSDWTPAPATGGGAWASPHGAPPGGATPAAQPGWGTSPPGATPASQPGWGASPPATGGAAPAPAWGTHAPLQPAPAKGSRGPLLVIGVGLFLALSVGAVAALGVGFAVFAGSSNSDEGWVSIDTDIQLGEVFVDGASQGPVVPGQRVRVRPGRRQLEIREAGVVTARGEANVTAGRTVSVSLRRSGGGGGGQGGGGGAVAVGPAQTHRGALRAGDPQLNSGEFTNTYEFDWVIGQRVILEANSDEFDTYLILRSPSGPQQDNDDREPGNTNAMLDVTLTETGRYRVLVTSYSPGEVGNYELLVRTP